MPDIEIYTQLFCPYCERAIHHSVPRKALNIGKSAPQRDQPPGAEAAEAVRRPHIRAADLY